eukprot:6365778-Prymnesium_polylepis.1
MSIAVLQSLRLMVCMSAQRDNLRVWRESSSTVPATRTGGDTECKNDNADRRLQLRPTTADNFTSLARGGINHPPNMFDKLRKTVCEQVEHIFLQATQIADCIQLAGGEFSWVQRQIASFTRMRRIDKNA